MELKKIFKMKIDWKLSRPSGFQLFYVAHPSAFMKYNQCSIPLSHSASLQPQDLGRGQLTGSD